MVKKSLFVCILMLGIIASNTIIAKTKVCLVKPSYDIIISQNVVKIIGVQNSLIIQPSGLINLNGYEVKTKPIIQKEAQQLQAYLRQQLPIFENEADRQLNNVHIAFETAIREKLGNKSELLKRLNELHGQLLELLHKSVITKEDVTYFYHVPFNNIKKEGEKIGEKVFYKILGDSVLNFNIFKNYSALKKIAKQEWKVQKVGLKSFDEHVCDLVTQIDDRYNHLMIGLH